MSLEKTHKVSIEGLQADAVWKVWMDVNNWHTWDHDIEWARLNGPFADGSSFELKPKGGAKVRIALSDVEEEKTFTDCARFPFAKMFSIHELRVQDGVIELSHTVKMTGPLKKLWWHLVARNVASGMEQQTNNLVVRARQISESKNAR